jgi:hypothetical protein
MFCLTSALAKHGLPAQIYTLESIDAVTPLEQQNINGLILRHESGYSTITGYTDTQLVMLINFCYLYFETKKLNYELDNLPYSKLFRFKI